MGKIIGTGEAARLLGVKPGQVNVWAKAGRLHGFRLVGGMWRFDEDYILEFGAALAKVGFSSPAQPRQTDTVTIREAAHLLDVAKPTIHRWIERGLIKAEKDDRGRLCIRRDDLHRPLCSPIHEQPEIDGYVTARQACEALSVAVETLCNWIRAGDLTPYRFYSRPYFKTEDIANIKRNNS